MRRCLPYVPGRLVPVSAGRFAASGLLKSDYFSPRAGTSPGEGPASPQEASAEPIAHGRGRDLPDTGQTTEGPVVDTLLPGWADKASYLLDAMLGDCTITVSHARGNDRGAPYEKEPKTSSLARTIPFAAHIV